MPRSAHSEWRRQNVHMLGAVVALLLLWVPTWFVALGFCLGFITLLILEPRDHWRLWRPHERGGSVGAVSYFLAGWLLFAVVPLPVAVVAWVTLTIGDGMATLIGHSWPLWTWPAWPTKSVGGSAAFVICSVLAVVIASWWLGGTWMWWQWLAVVGTIVVAAVAEVVTPRWLDDNLVIPVVVAVLLWPWL